MNRILITCFFAFFTQIAFPQFSFRETHSIPVSQNGTSIGDPFTGGYNNAQFGEMDLNQDGIIDLIIYDRFRGQIRPYLNAGIEDSVSYTYAPEYERLFPEMDEFLVTADYNQDGRIDLISGGSALRLFENTSTTAGGLRFDFQGAILSRFSNSGNPFPINPTASNYPGVIDIDGDGDLDFFVVESPGRIDYHRNLSIDFNNDFNSEIQRRSRCWGVFFEGFNSDSTRLDSIHLDSCLQLPFRLRGERNNGKGLKHGSGLTISPIDYDNNSSTDLLIADDGSYSMTMVLNDDSIGPPYINSRIFDVLEPFPNDDTPINILFAAAFFIDVNNDGKKDMLAASNQQNTGPLPPFSTDEIWYYENTSNTDRFKFSLRTKSFLRDNTLDFGLCSKPIFIDYNKDGLQDILVGNLGYLSPNDSNTFISQLALLENTGTPSNPEYELIDINYLDLPSIDFGIKDTLFDLASPAAGDIDGDGDVDLLITMKTGDIFLFEDTAVQGAPAAFKINTTPFQNLADQVTLTQYATLFDVDNDGTLELVTGNRNVTQYHVNFRTRTNPLFNIPLDSFFRIGQDTMRYHLSTPIDYSKIEIGDSLAVNNAVRPDNFPLIPLIVVNVDSTNHFIDCINTIFGGVSDSRFDERTTTAHLKEFQPNWNFFTPSNGLIMESIFFFRDRDNDTNQVFIGALGGDSYFFENFGTRLNRISEVEGLIRNTLPDFGQNSFINGADINNDGHIDLVIGLGAGGIKLLLGEGPVGILESGNTTSELPNLFRVYPNPSNKQTTIELLNPNLSASYSIYDISGKLIQKENFQGQQKLVDLATLPKGIYLLQLTNNHKVQTKKLVIQP